ncbi:MULTISPECIES: RHS repeat-associated core domain-containing protein [Cupriavidus]
MTHPPPTAKKRPEQVAVAPLNTIDIADVGRGAAQFDAWLRRASGNVVTLERIQTVAGALPVVGNIMALVDALGDIVTLANSKTRQLLDWVSLGINLIGVLPMPPSMAAARMSLRPTLFLVRQELRNGLKMVLGDALIEVLIGHLNATIVGSIDDFVQKAQAKLGGILQDAAALGEKAVLEIANGLQAAAQGRLDAGGDAKAAGRQAREAGKQLLHDPKAAIGNLFGAAWRAYKAAGKSVANVAAKTLLPEQAKRLILDSTGMLRQFAPELRAQVGKLGDPAVQHSIGWLLLILGKAVLAWRKRHGQGRSANVKPDTTSQHKNQHPQNPLGATGKQSQAAHDANPKKNGTCTGTCGSISFATGSETIAHLDFSLPGPFPIEWTRLYRSSLGAYDHGELGARWITPFTTRIDLRKDGVRYHAADGRSHDYPLPKVGKFHYDPIEHLTLIRSAEDELMLARGHDSRETYLRHGERFLLGGIVLRGGAGLLLRYEHHVGNQAVLSDLISYQDDLSQVHSHLGTLVDEAGRITGLWLLGDEEIQRQLCAYRYDDAGDLALARDENAAAWTYQYRHHLITRYTDRTGRGMHLEWQGDGPDARAIHEWADDGSFETRLEWDENIRLTYVTDAHGEETWHYYDILGYTYRTTHPDGRSAWFFRDDAKNVVRHVHPDGSTDRYAYDERGNLLEHIRADDSIVHYAWDDKDQLIKISDAEGGQWRRDYDIRGNLTEAIDPLGNKTEYAYNINGLPVSMTDANGKQKQLAYNAAGQLTGYTDCSGKASAWQYDERGQLSRFTDALGQVTAYRYQAGQLATVVHPDLSEEHFARDAEGRLLAHVDALGQRTDWTYGEAGLLAQRVDAAGQSLRYQWDRLGQLQRLENENGRQAAFHYDPVGRLLEETGFDGAITRYHYQEETGVLASAVDGQRVTAFAFDALGRLTERRAALQPAQGAPGDGDWQRERFAYDGNGNLILAANAASRLQWFHDAAGNLVREHQHYSYMRQPLVAVWQHEYDALNQRIATVRPDGHRVSWLTYGSGHLLGLRLDAHDLLAYERDDLHREITRHQGNGLRQSQVWDPAGRLREQVLAPGGEPQGPAHTGQAGAARLAVRSYRYDAAGQLTGIQDLRRGDLAYRYDPVGRLLEASSRLGRETFAFDPASNLLDLAPAQNAQRGRHSQDDPPRSKALDNLLREYAGTHYRYDERGNLIRRWHDGQESRFTWDLFDRLTHYVDERLHVDYGYDALGRRLYKDAEPAQQANAAAERLARQRELGCGMTVYGWDGDTLAWESTVADEGGLGARTVHYLYEPSSFVPVAQAVRQQTMALRPEPEYGDDYRRDEDPLWEDASEPPPIGALAWYQCDHLGTPQELTDQRGQIAWSAEYRAWGVAREAIHKASDGRVPLTTPIRFQGQYHDRETGLHYNRYRYYDPGSGRFISKDPIGLAGGFNVYQYAPNPVGWIDPLGLAKDDTLKPGPFAVESIPAHRGRPTADEQRQVNVLMEKHGCHTCGTKDAGTKSGNAIADHQPAQALGEPEIFLPHCNACKARQGGQVLQEKLRRARK